VQPLADARGGREAGPGPAPDIQNELGAAREVGGREARERNRAGEVAFEAARRQTIDDRTAAGRFLSLDQDVEIAQFRLPDDPAVQQPLAESERDGRGVASAADRFEERQQRRHRPCELDLGQQALQIRAPARITRRLDLLVVLDIVGAYQPEQQPGARLGFQPEQLVHEGVIGKEFDQQIDRRGRPQPETVADHVVAALDEAVFDRPHEVVKPLEAVGWMIGEEHVEDHAPLRQAPARSGFARRSNTGSARAAATLAVIDVSARNFARAASAIPT